MATTKEDIRRWLWKAKEDGATHMLVVCDTFNFDDFPSYVMPGQDVHEKIKEVEKAEMQRLMECYHMSMDLEAQLAEKRAHHPELPPNEPKPMEPFRFVFEGATISWMLSKGRGNVAILTRVDDHDPDQTTTIYLPIELLEQFAEQWAKESNLLASEPTTRKAHKK